MRKGRLISRVIKRANIGLKDAVPAGSVDIIGDIAILKIPEVLDENESELAEILLEEAPYVKVVYRQTGPVSGEYRLRDLKWLAGEKRSTTVHREHGCEIEADLEKDYFSPRLAHERTRIARLVKAEEDNSGSGEVIINMFAGVGTFSLRIAKETKLSKIYSIDKNHDAFLRMFKNVMANRMLGRVVCILGETKQIVDQILTLRADRVLMPLPEKSLEYLETALSTLKQEGGMIHFQTFIHAGKEEDPVDVSRARLHVSLQGYPWKFMIEDEKVIRTVGPRWYQVAHDLKVIPL